MRLKTMLNFCLGYDAFTVWILFQMFKLHLKISKPQKMKILLTGCAAFSLLLHEEQLLEEMFKKQK